jgi:hypothetical protein
MDGSNAIQDPTLLNPDIHHIHHHIHQLWSIPSTANKEVDDIIIVELQSSTAYVKRWIRCSAF